MDQDQEPTPEAPQPDVQPVSDVSQQPEFSVPAMTPVETTESPVAEPTPQVEESPVNPFATPEVTEPVAMPASTEPAPETPPFAAAPQVDAVPPVFSTTPAPDQAPVAKKSHAGLIIGLVVGFVALLVLVGIAGFIWFTNFYVSKADYQQVSSVWTQLHDINTSLSGMGSAVSSSNVSASDINSKVDELDAKVKELGTLRAVQKDTDLKKAYDALLPNVQEQVTVSRAAASFIQASNDCGKITDKTQVSTCVTELRAVKDDSAGGTVKALASAMADYVDGALAGKYVSYSAQESAFTKYDSDLTKKITDTGNAFSTILSKKLQ